MKLRTLLLGTLMVVVPLLAMFSHLIPADVRAAARTRFRDSIDGWFGTPAEAGVPVAAALEGHGPEAARRGGQPQSSGEPPAESRPIAAGAPLPPQSGKPPSGGKTVGLRPVTTAETATAVEPALVAQLGDRSRSGRDHRQLEARLAALGAIAFECQPVPGAPGVFASACRVPVDPTGQLQRVFQATGADPSAATEALVEQVAAWRQRATPPLPATGSEPPAGDRGG